MPRVFLKLRGIKRSGTVIKWLPHIPINQCIWNGCEEDLGGIEEVLASWFGFGFPYIIGRPGGRTAYDGDASRAGVVYLC